MTLYQLLDDEGFDPIGEALPIEAVEELLLTNPDWTYREYTVLDY